MQFLELLLSREMPVDLEMRKPTQSFQLYVQDGRTGIECALCSCDFFTTHTALVLIHQNSLLFKNTFHAVEQTLKKHKQINLNKDNLPKRKRKANKQPNKQNICQPSMLHNTGLSLCGLTSFHSRCLLRALALPSLPALQLVLMNGVDSVVFSFCHYGVGSEHLLSFYQVTNSCQAFYGPVSTQSSPQHSKYTVLSLFHCGKTKGHRGSTICPCPQSWYQQSLDWRTELMTQKPMLCLRFRSQTTVVQQKQNMSHKYEPNM